MLRIKRHLDPTDDSLNVDQRSNLTFTYPHISWPLSSLTSPSLSSSLNTITRHQGAFGSTHPATEDPLEMEMEIQRPQTPPPSYLLTPPPTGGFSKRVRFSNAVTFKHGTNSKSRHLAKSGEGESPTAFFNEPQEGSETELSDISECETTPSTDEISTASSSSATSTSSVTSKRSVLEKHDPFASLAIAVDAPATITNPFPFMQLPLSVRDKVYEHLLVIPAITCVRQKHTSYHDEKKAILYAERRELLPGIAYALAQLTVNGYKIRFSRFATTNINILCVNKEVHVEAKAVLYGKNKFEIVKPTNEMSPPPDFSVRLFPPGCQRLVTKLNMRIRSFYDLHWLVSGGYNVIKNHYRNLDTLTLILEMDSANKGFGKEWSRKGQEKWTAYIKRLHGDLTKDVFGNTRSENTKLLPTWINLRVLFDGESYDDKYVSEDATHSMSDDTVQQVKRDELRHALLETWELFKKGGR